MGKRLITNVAEAPNMELSGALEAVGCPLLGRDAGTVAGISPAHVAITASIPEALANADAVIIFSTGGVPEIAEAAAERNVAMVIGATALAAEAKARLAELARGGARIVFSSNMSVGVNLLFNLARRAAELLGGSYDIEVVEMHHNQKKDAPSGTAVTLAEILCEARDLSYERDVRHGRVGQVGARPGNEIGMHSLRGGDVVGDHTVIFAANGERLELTHKASSRDTFAQGALRAVNFLCEGGGKSGGRLFDMQDVLGLK